MKAVSVDAGAARCAPYTWVLVSLLLAIPFLTGTALADDLGGDNSKRNDAEWVKKELKVGNYDSFTSVTIPGLTVGGAAAGDIRDVVVHLSKTKDFGYQVWVTATNVSKTQKVTLSVKFLRDGKTWDKKPKENRWDGYSHVLGPGEFHRVGHLGFNATDHIELKIEAKY